MNDERGRTAAQSEMRVDERGKSAALKMKTPHYYSEVPRWKLDLPRYNNRWKMCCRVVRGMQLHRNRTTRPLWIRVVDRVPMCRVHPAPQHLLLKSDDDLITGSNLLGRIQIIGFKFYLSK